MDTTTEFLTRALEAGVPKDQIENFLSGGYIPQPKQLQFHAACRAADADDGPTEIGFGGARGPGKSHAMFTQIALDDCQRVDGLKCLLLRKVGKALKESAADLRAKILRTTPHNYNKSTGTITFPNGSRVILGHFRTEDDIASYVGLEYDLIAVEECTTLSGQKYRLIRTCCRTSKEGWRPRMYSNANPGGIGHQFYLKRFIQGSSPDVRFIAATCRDNVFLDANYIRTLESLTGWLRRAWLEGDWNIHAGTYFTGFEAKVHVIPPRTLLHGEYTFYLAMDYGWQHPTVAIVLAQAGNGDVFAVAEYGASKKLPEWHSKEMLGMLSHTGIHRDWLRDLVIGADAYRTRSDGKCVADDYERLGWQLESAKMSRIEGATEILRRLGDAEVGIRPSLFIFNTCPRLIEQVAAMQHDPKRPEDVLKVNIDEEGEGGDDFYDALRYGLMQLATPPVEWGPAPVWQRRSG